MDTGPPLGRRLVEVRLDNAAEVYQLLAIANAHVALVKPRQDALHVSGDHIDSPLGDLGCNDRLVRINAHCNNTGQPQGLQVGTIPQLGLDRVAAVNSTVRLGVESVQQGHAGWVKLDGAAGAIVGGCEA